MGGPDPEQGIESSDSDFAMTVPTKDKTWKPIAQQPGRRRSALPSSTDIPVNAVIPQCAGGHDLRRFLTPYDGYSCSNCTRPFPWYTVLHSCRECDFDLCTRCITRIAAPERQRAQSLDDVPGASGHAGTVAVQDKIKNRKAGVASPGSPMDGKDKAKKQGFAARMMSSDIFGGLTQGADERREEAKKKRERAEVKAKEREEYFAKEEAYKDRKKVERAEALLTAKENEKELKEIAKQNAILKKEAKAMQKKKKELLAKEKAREDERAVKLRKIQMDEKAKEKQVAAARKKAEKSRGKPLSVQLYSMLPSIDLSSMLSSGSLSKGETKKVEEAQKIAAKKETKDKMERDAFERKVAKDKAELELFEKESKAAAMQRRKLMEDRQKEYEGNRKMRAQDCAVVQKEKGDVAATVGDERARKDLKASNNRQEKYLIEKEKKQADWDSKQAAKVEVRKLKMDPELAKALYKSRKAADKKALEDRAKEDAEALKAAQVDLDGDGMPDDFDQLCKMSTTSLNTLLAGGTLSESAVVEVNEALSFARKEEYRDAARGKALLAAEKALAKQEKADAAAEAKRLKAEKAEDAAWEKKAQAEEKKATADDAKMAKKVETGERKRAKMNAKFLAKVETMAIKGKAKRAAELDMVAENDKYRKEQEEVAYANTIADLENGTPLVATGLNLLTSTSCRKLKASGKLVKEEDKQLVDENNVLAIKEEQAERAEAERVQERFQREIEAEEAMAELCKKRAKESEIRAVAKAERAVKAKAVNDATRARREKERKERADAKAAKEHANAALLAKQNSTHSQVMKDLKAGKPLSKEILDDDLGDVTSVQLGDILELIEEGKTPNLTDDDAKILKQMVKKLVIMEINQKEEMFHLEQDEAKRLKRMNTRLGQEARARSKAAAREDRLETMHEKAELKEADTAEKAQKLSDSTAKLKAEAEGNETKAMAARIKAEAQRKKYEEETLARFAEEKKERVAANEVAVSEAREARRAEQEGSAQEWVDDALTNFGQDEEGKPQACMNTELLVALGPKGINKLLKNGALKHEKDVAKAKRTLPKAQEAEDDFEFDLKAVFSDSEGKLEKAQRKEMDMQRKKIEAEADKADSDARSANAKHVKEEGLAARAAVAHKAAERRVEWVVTAKERNVRDTEELEQLHAEQAIKSKAAEEAEHEESLRQRKVDKEEMEEAREYRDLKYAEFAARRAADEYNFKQIDFELGKSMPLNFKLLGPMGSRNLLELLQSSILTTKELARVSDELDRAFKMEAAEQKEQEDMERNYDNMLRKKARQMEQARRKEERRLQAEIDYHERLENRTAETQRAEEAAEDLKARLTEQLGERRIELEEAVVASEKADVEGAEKKLVARQQLKRDRIENTEWAREKYTTYVKELKKKREAQRASALAKVEKSLKAKKEIKDDYFNGLGSVLLGDLIAEGRLEVYSVDLHDEAAGAVANPKKAKKQKSKVDPLLKEKMLAAAAKAMKHCLAEEAKEAQTTEQRRLNWLMEAESNAKKSERNVRVAADNFSLKCLNHVETCEQRVYKAEQALLKAEANTETKKRRAKRAAQLRDQDESANVVQAEARALKRAHDETVMERRRKDKEAKAAVDEALATGKPLDEAALADLGPLSIGQLLYSPVQLKDGTERKWSHKEKTALEAALEKAKVDDEALKKSEHEVRMAEERARAEAAKGAKIHAKVMRLGGRDEDKLANADLKKQMADKKAAEQQRKVEAKKKRMDALNAQAEIEREEADEAREAMEEERRLGEEAQAAETKKNKAALEKKAKKQIYEELAAGKPVSDGLFRCLGTQALIELEQSGKLKHSEEEAMRVDRAKANANQEEAQVAMLDEKRKAEAAKAAAKQDARRAKEKQKLERLTKNAEKKVAKAEKKATKAVAKAEKADAKAAARGEKVHGKQDKESAAEAARDRLEAQAGKGQPLDPEDLKLALASKVPLGPEANKAHAVMKNENDEKTKKQKELDRKVKDMKKLHEAQLKEEEKEKEAMEKKAAAIKLKKEQEEEIAKLRAELESEAPATDPVAL